MGAQPAKVYSSLEMLRGTPIQVWNKTEHRWVNAVVGSPKDVRESPPNPTAVLVLYQEKINGRSDGYKWIRQEDIPQLIRARPEMAKEAGMMQSVMDTFGTMYDNPSAYQARPTGVQPMAHHPMSSNCSMGSIPIERPEAHYQAGVMDTIMASVGLAPQTSNMLTPSASFNAMVPSASFASTVDQNSIGGQRHFPRAGSMASTIPEDRVGFLDSIMGTVGLSQPGQQYNQYNPYNQYNQQAPPTMNNNIHDPMRCMKESQPEYKQPEYIGGGVMASIMGMGMGSVAGSQPVSRAGSFAPSMVVGENRSPNRTPMGSMTGSAKGSACGNMYPQKPPSAQAMNPMTSFMSSFIQMPVGHSAAQHAQLHSAR